MVYHGNGWPERGDRDKTWELLQRVKRNEREEWLCIGDFNEIMWSIEIKVVYHELGMECAAFERW